jgi:hypothetical protein
VLHLNHEEKTATSKVVNRPPQSNPYEGPDEGLQKVKIISRSVVH